MDNLARCGIRKKIASIEEIDLLKGLNWTSHVRCLNIEGHALTSCSIKLLKQVFPNLKKIQCNNNQIFRVNETLDDSVERIELDDNPFTSITLSNADTFKNTEVIVDGSILEKVNFNPNINDKCKAWIKAFKIKSRIAAKSFARGIIENWQEKIKVILPTLALVDVTGNILTNAHRWCIGSRLKYEPSSWKLLTILGITYWIQVSEPSINWAFIKEKNPDKHGYFYSLRIKGSDHNSYKTQQVYPSPYMYNLFGKH